MTGGDAQPGTHIGCGGLVAETSFGYLACAECAELPEESEVDW